jgi:uncharacterized SAM-binding protein YcdF (DUF218 family)
LALDSATLFFTLSKVFAFFTLPTNVIVLAGFVGALLMPTRFGRTGRYLAAVALILLAVIGWSPLSRILTLTLERQFPPWSTSAGDPAGIIVLGGSIDGRMSGARQSIVLTESAERLTTAVDLARRYPRARLIFTGGSGSLMFPEAREAPIARQVFASLAIPIERIEIEDRSRNTVENAIFTKRIANPKPGERWLLVTSAFHMPRAMGVFRKANFPVEAYPVDWRTAGPDDSWAFSNMASSSFRRFDIAVHEWIGLAIYWLSGRTSEFLPGPRSGGCDLTNRLDSCRP